MVLDVLLQPKEFVTTTENEEGKEMVGVIEAVVAEVFQTYVYPAAATALIVTVAGSATHQFGPVITANGSGFIVTVVVVVFTQPFASRTVRLTG